MSAVELLSRCDGVRETGQGRYVSRCPAHDDRSPSLSITEADDGRTLVYCHGGCETEDVLAAVGMTFSDIMPERIGSDHGYKKLRQPFDARQVLAAASHELTVVRILANQIAGQLPEEDRQRAILAAERLGNAISLSGSLGTPKEIKNIRRAA